MKNKFILYSSIVFVSILFAACSDWLQPKFYSEATGSTFPISDNDVNTALAAIYGNFSAGYGPLDPSIVNGQKDDKTLWSIYSGTKYGWCYISNSTTDEMHDDWRKLNTKFGWKKDESDYLYRSLYNKASAVAKMTQYIDIFNKQLLALNKNPKSVTNDSSISIRKRAVGELKCLRGWMMFLLYDWFGAVDVRWDPSELSNTSCSNRPAADPTSDYTRIYRYKMIQDLREAISEPKVYEKFNSKPDDWGHVSKDVARFLLMKHYMNYAAELEQNVKGSGSVFWDSAQIYCDQLINNNHYSLNVSYPKVFTDIDLAKGPLASNSEIIWSTTFGVTYDVNLKSCWFSANVPGGVDKVLSINTSPSAGWSTGGYCIPWSQYDMYDTTGVSIGSPNDQRLLTIADRYHDISNGIVSRFSNQQPLIKYGALAIKYLIADPALNSDGQFSIVAMRYADVLLSYAEIQLNRPSGNIDQAIKYVKQVFNRSSKVETVSRTFTAKVPNKEDVSYIKNVVGSSSIVSGVSIDTLAEFIYQERGRELYWEGWRRSDMIRFKSLNPLYSNKYMEFASYFVTVNDKNDNHLCKFPLPYKVTNEAQGKYVDNKGY